MADRRDAPVCLECGATSEEGAGLRVVPTSRPA